MQSRQLNISIIWTILALPIAAGTVVFHSVCLKSPACQAAPYQHIYQSERVNEHPPVVRAQPAERYLLAEGTEEHSKAKGDEQGAEQHKTAEHKESSNQAAQDKEVGRDDAKAQTKADLPNFHEVHPYLYRSGEPSSAGIKKLHELGIKTLIDLRAPSEKALDEKKEAEHLGMHYINLPMTAKAPTDEQVKTMLSTIEKAKEKNEKVLVHCAHGSDRTGCMIGIWRVTHDGWNFDETYKEMRKYYFGPKYNMLRDAVKTRAEH